MQKRVKIDYNQYKHLIDVCNTGDFLIESLEDQKELILGDRKINYKVRDLLTKDNVLYWTQNTKRTFKVPVGFDSKNNLLLEIDLMSCDYGIKSNCEDDLKNFNNLFILNLLQSYAPSEYAVYSDCLSEDFKGLDNFYNVTDCEELDKLYSNLAQSRHKKYLESGVYNYRDYRKNNQESYCLFLLSGKEMIKRVNSICGNSHRYGIAIVSLSLHSCVDKLSISLTESIRPRLTRNEIENELKEYNKLIGDIKNMKKNLIIGFEENNDDDLHENLLFIEDISKCPSALYNMREYGYQFGGLNARGDFGSNYHHLLRDCHELEKDAVDYIIKASVYDVVFLKSTSLRIAIRDNDGLSSHDRTLLDEFVSKQVEHYYEERNYFDMIDYESVLGNRTIYAGRFCRIVKEGLSLFFIMENKKILLPRSFIYFLKLSSENGRLELNERLINLIISHELIGYYGYLVPDDYVDDYWAGSTTVRGFEKVLTTDNLLDVEVADKEIYKYLQRGKILKVLEDNGTLLHAVLSTEQEELLDKFLEYNWNVPRTIDCEYEIDSEDRIVYSSDTFEILVKDKKLNYKSITGTITKLPSSLFKYLGSSTVIPLIDCNERYKLNISESRLKRVIDRNNKSLIKKSSSF